MYSVFPQSSFVKLRMQPLLFFLLLALSLSPFLFLRCYDFGASFTQMTANLVRLGFWFLGFGFLINS